MSTPRGGKFPALHSAPAFRSLDQLTGEHAGRSGVTAVLDAADKISDQTVEAERLREENARLRAAVELQQDRQKCLAAIDTEIAQIETDLSTVREENARLTRDNALLTRQLNALLDTDRGELLTRNQELAEELDHVRELLAEKVGECATWRRRALAACSHEVGS